LTSMLVIGVTSKFYYPATCVNIYVNGVGAGTFKM
jgi:hypothetical protein